MWPVIRPVALAAGETRSLNERVPVKVRSLDTTGALAAVAMPLVARVATAAVAVMTRNVCMCHTIRTMLEPQASGDVAAMRVALRSCYPESTSTRWRGDRDPVV